MIVMGSSLQAFSMGQPHNVFAARKHMRTQNSVFIVEEKVAQQEEETPLCWHAIFKATRTMFSELVIVAFSHISPVHTF